MQNKDTYEEKTILKDSFGYVRPGELVAVMGPSGSGKTTLLNALSNRLSALKGGHLSGEITCNGQRIRGNDFSKFGAYVQQDDHLHASLSCREHLEFAARMRTVSDDEL